MRLLNVGPSSGPRYLPGCFWCSLFTAGYPSDPGFMKLGVPSQDRGLSGAHRAGTAISGSVKGIFFYLA